MVKHTYTYKARHLFQKTPKSHLFIHAKCHDWEAQILRWCEMLQCSPSWRWRGLPAPGCPGLWRTHARGRCVRCLCGWASRRGTTSLAAQSTGSSPACQWRCPAAARRWPGNDEGCLFWSTPGGQRERHWKGLIPPSFVARNVILSISKHLLKSKEQADKRRWINYGMMYRYIIFTRTI